MYLKKLKVKSLLWLITQHSKHKGWGFPKGLIGDKDSKESMEDAALREVEEEGGVKAKIVIDKPFEVKYKYRFAEYLIDKTVYYFLMEFISGDPKNHDRLKALQVIFVPSESMLLSRAKWHIRPHLTQLLTRILNHNGYKKVTELDTKGRRDWINGEYLDKIPET